MASLLRKKQERHLKWVCVPRVEVPKVKGRNVQKKALILGFLAQPALGRLLTE